MEPIGLGGVLGHRLEEHAQLLLRVAERLLPTHHRRVRVHDVLALGEVLQVHEAVGQPLLVRLRRGELGLDLVVLDDPVLRGVDEEACDRAAAGPCGRRLRAR